MKRVLVLAGVASLAAVLAVIAAVAIPAGQAKGFNYGDLNQIQKRLVSGALAMALDPAPSPPPGVAAPHLSIVGGAADDDNAEVAPTAPPSSFGSPSGGGGQFGGNYYPRGSDQCAENLGGNIKVNQNCVNVSDPDLQGRGQAQNETSIAIDPTDPNHVIGSYNDYRRGDGNCYGSYSLDGGRTWEDTTIPMSFTRGLQVNSSTPPPYAREYWQAGGDTSVAWDTKGNAYFSCQMFNRGNGVSPDSDQSSGFFVFRSTGNAGASWNFPGRPDTTNADFVGTGAVLEDKQLMTVDNNLRACPSSQTTVTPGSRCTPFQDRVYVSWTEFAADGSAYIWESYSNDYGEHFSPRVLVSANSPLCTQTYGAGTPQGSCNENQFSQPFVAPDGTLYVVWANFNNSVRGNDNRNQMLIAKSVDGGNSFSPPQKVSDYYDLPDCATYQGGQDAGRACVPEKGPSMDSIFRAVNYPVGQVNPYDPSQVVVTFGSYINQHSNESNGCVPAGFNPATGDNTYTGVKTPGACNNDILVSVSNDAGATFTGTTADPRVEPTVTPTTAQALSDQFWQWSAFTKQGKLAVMYYDRQYGRPVGVQSGAPAVPSDEATGYSDVSLSSVGAGPRGIDVNVQRVTSSSMPPPTQFSGLFYGDYTGLAALDKAYPIWMDTRDPEPFLCPGTGTPGSPPQVCTGQDTTATGTLTANDQNIYVASVGVSNGGGDNH